MIKSRCHWSPATAPGSGFILPQVGGAEREKRESESEGKRKRDEQAGGGGGGGVRSRFTGQKCLFWSILELRPVQVESA